MISQLLTTASKVAKNFIKQEFNSQFSPFSLKWEQVRKVAAQTKERTGNFSGSSITFYVVSTYLYIESMIFILILRLQRTILLEWFNCMEAFGSNVYIWIPKMKHQSNWFFEWLWHILICISQYFSKLSIFSECKRTNKGSLLSQSIFVKIPKVLSFE